MTVLALTAVGVLVIDQALKLLLRRTGPSDSMRLGPYGSLRMVAGRLWVHRVSGRSAIALCLWILSSGALVVGSAWIPSSRVFVGLLIGGSLSNAIEGSLRGSVTDYVCLRFWPAFNLADVALTAGAVGIGVELLRAIGETAA
jgi:lipoprotein signal peptidase